MGRYTPQPSQSAEIADIKRRLRELERTQRALFTEVGGVPLLQLATGLRVGVEDGLLLYTSDQGWDISDPILSNVQVTGGRLIVIVSASITTSDYQASGLMSWELEDQYGVTIAVPDTTRALACHVEDNTGFGRIIQAAYMYPHDSLPSGTYTIRAAYRLTTRVTPSSPSATIQHRSMIAIPY